MARVKSNVKSNYDIFAERGDPWDTPGFYKRPRVTSPITGKISLPRSAVIKLLHEFREGSAVREGRASESCLRQRAKTPSQSPPENPDLDRYLLAGKSIPFSIRLAKERNTLLSAQDNIVPHGERSPSPGYRLASARAKLSAVRRVIKA